MLSFGCFVEDSLFIQDTRFIHLSHFLCIHWPYMTSEMTLILQSNQNETKYERNRYISNRERYRHNVLHRIQCIVKVHIIKYKLMKISLGQIHFFIKKNSNRLLSLSLHQCFLKLNPFYSNITKLSGQVYFINSYI